MHLVLGGFVELDMHVPRVSLSEGLISWVILAVAAETRGIVSAEGVPGAALVVVFTGLLVGSIVRED